MLCGDNWSVVSGEVYESLWVRRPRLRSSLTIGDELAVVSHVNDVGGCCLARDGCGIETVCIVCCEPLAGEGDVVAGVSTGGAGEGLTYLERASIGGGSGLGQSDISIE